MGLPKGNISDLSDSELVAIYKNFGPGALRAGALFSC